MAYTVVIPARYGSSRLPGKPLLDIQGKPMVQRVWEQACASGAEKVVIATDDQRICGAAEAFGAQVCMTSPDHPSGTDRLQEVATALSLAPDHILVNVQGDEPLIPPAVIDQVAQLLMEREDAAMATLCEHLATLEEVTNPNIVKVVLDHSGRALYFSRAPIPWPRDAFAAQEKTLPLRGTWQRHIGIYAYRAKFLHDYVTWPPAPSEQLEQLEQLRALHNGVTVQVDVARAPVPGGVDTQADLDHIRDLLAAAGEL